MCWHNLSSVTHIEDSFLSSVRRARGHFGDVTVFWQLFANDSASPLEENEEFTSTSGSITFTTGEEAKPIILQAISDQLPEFNEFFVLKLVNISGKKNMSLTNASSFGKQSFPIIFVNVLKTVQVSSMFSLRWLPRGRWAARRVFPKRFGSHPFQRRPFWCLCHC